MEATLTDAELTRFLAVLGAITGSIGSILAITALCWDIFKWRKTERCRLRVELMPNMKQHILMGVDQDVIVIRVTNVGKLTTFITLLAINDCRGSRLTRILRRLHLIDQEAKAFWIRESEAGKLPKELKPGHEWVSTINKRSPEINAFLRENNKIWVSVSHSMSEKSVYKRLPGVNIPKLSE